MAWDPKHARVWVVIYSRVKSRSKTHRVLLQISTICSEINTRVTLTLLRKTDKLFSPGLSLPHMLFLLTRLQGTILLWHFDWEPANLTISSYRVSAIKKWHSVALKVFYTCWTENEIICFVVGSNSMRVNSPFLSTNSALDCVRAGPGLVQQHSGKTRIRRISLWQTLLSISKRFNSALSLPLELN